MRERPRKGIGGAVRQHQIWRALPFSNSLLPPAFGEVGERGEREGRGERGGGSHAIGHVSTEGVIFTVATWEVEVSWKGSKF